MAKQTGYKIALVPCDWERTGDTATTAGMKTANKAFKGFRP
jgi:hypothetical protein